MSETSSTSLLGPRFEQALVYAAMLHAGQVRKSTPIPYVSHVLAVSAIALEHGANEDEAIAALLHDAVEDCGGKPRLLDIRHRFGATVADIVAGCTDADVTPKPPWEERKRQYIEHVKTASPSVLLVSCSDKVHNARSIVADLRAGVDVFALFKGGKDGTLWYYRSLLEIFQQRNVPPRLVAELARSVSEMQSLAGEV
jgi:(p)ppGpp synthase/HD superfamily hydrolase